MFIKTLFSKCLYKAISVPFFLAENPFMCLNCNFYLENYLIHFQLHLLSTRVFISWEILATNVRVSYLIEKQCILILNLLRVVHNLNYILKYKCSFLILRITKYFVLPKLRIPVYYCWSFRKVCNQHLEHILFDIHSWNLYFRYLKRLIFRYYQLKVLLYYLRIKGNSYSLKVWKHIQNLLI